MRTILKRFLSDCENFGEVDNNDLFEGNTRKLQKMLVDVLYNVKDYDFLGNLGKKIFN